MKSSTQWKRHPGNETVSSWSPILSCWEPGALLLSIEYLTLGMPCLALLGDVLRLLGRIPSLLWFLGWAKTQHEERSAVCKRDGSTRLQSTAPIWLCRNEVFLFWAIRTSEMFSSIFQKENSLLFNYSVFSLLCGEEQLCSDLCLSLAKDSYHPELQHQGSHGKLLKGNTALLKPWNMLRRKQVTFATSITRVSYVPCKGGNSVGTGSCVSVPVSKTATMQMPERHFSGAVTMLYNLLCW